MTTGLGSRSPPPRRRESWSKSADASTVFGHRRHHVEEVDAKFSGADQHDQLSPERNPRRRARSRARSGDVQWSPCCTRQAEEAERRTFCRRQTKHDGTCCRDWRPTHKRTTWTAGKVKKGSHFTMDNLFNGPKTCSALKSLHGVTCSGVFRSDAGMPECVEQERHPTGSAAAAAKGTVKVAVSKGNPALEDVVVAAVCDQGPVCLGSNRATEVKWVERTRKVWCPRSNERIEVKSWRLNVNDERNGSTRHVDVADQLREACRPDRLARKAEWTWAAFVFLVGVALTNACVTCRVVVSTADAPALTHSEFLWETSRCWLDSTTHQSKHGDGAVTTPEPTPSPARRTCRTAKRLDGTGKRRSKTLVSEHALQPLPRRTAHGAHAKCSFHKFRQQVHNDVDVDGGALQTSSEDVEGFARAKVKCVECRVALCLSCWAPHHSCERAHGETDFTVPQKSRRP